MFLAKIHLWHHRDSNKNLKNRTIYHHVLHFDDGSLSTVSYTYTHLPMQAQNELITAEHN